MLKKVFLCFAIIWICPAHVNQSNCLFKNPLCFYNTDILTFLQVLHKNQQYDKMNTFFYGEYKNSVNKRKFIDLISNVNFGYSLKRVGIKKTSTNKWSLTYQRTILGTNENFKIECKLINDTCRIYLNKNEWNEIFLNSK